MIMETRLPDRANIALPVKSSTNSRLQSANGPGNGTSIISRNSSVNPKEKMDVIRHDGI